MAVKWEVVDTLKGVVIQRIEFFHGASLYNDYRRKEITKMANTKIKIRLKSYDHRLLDQSAKKIVESVKKAGSEVNGPIPLPTEKEIFTILRSPHVNKDSREQFERRTHKRLIEIVNPNSQTIEALTHIDIPSGVDIVLKNN